MLYRVVNFTLIISSLFLILLWAYASNFQSDSIPSGESNISFSFTISGFINDVDLKQLYAGLNTTDLENSRFQSKITRALNGQEKVVFLQCKLENSENIGEYNLTKIPLFIGYLYDSTYDIKTNYSQKVNYGNYGIFCLMEYNGHQYGAKASYHINQPVKNIDLILRPILGPIITTPIKIKKLAYYQKEISQKHTIKPWKLIRFSMDEKRIYQGNPKFTHSEFYINPDLSKNQGPNYLHQADHLRAQINHRKK